MQKRDRYNMSFFQNQICLIQREASETLETHKIKQQSTAQTAAPSKIHKLLALYPKNAITTAVKFIFL